MGAAAILVMAAATWSWGTPMMPGRSEAPASIFESGAANGEVPDQVAAGSGARGLLDKEIIRRIALSPADRGEG